MLWLGGAGSESFELAKPLILDYGRIWGPKAEIMAIEHLDRRCEMFPAHRLQYSEHTNLSFLNSHALVRIEINQHLHAHPPGCTFAYLQPRGSLRCSTT